MMSGGVNLSHPMSDEINQELLNEIRKLGRHSWFSLWFMLGLTAAVGIYFTWLRQEQQRSWQAYYQAQAQAARQANGTQEAVWPAIEAALDRGDNQKALSIARSFVARQPGYYYSHTSLGNVYLATGDYTNAEAAYVKAVELFPHEDNEKVLAAVRKRLARERDTPAPAR
jgi:cytochrome c-type biogenesis protein CcmH/NrfG